MNTTLELTANEMYRASQNRDTEYDGVFFMAVKTTGIFCRPACPARKPLQKNVIFFDTANAALNAGYRPCKKCRPLEISGTMPDWLAGLVRHFEQDPTRRWTDQDIRDHGVEPKRVRRWFQRNHAITFHAFLRSRRLASALAQLSVGQDATQVAYDAGFESLSGFRDAFQKWFGQTPGSATGNRHRRQDQQAVLAVNRILTPLGPLVAAANEQSLYLLEFADRRMLETQFQRLGQRLGCRFSPSENKVIREAEKQLRQYFDGDRRDFSLPIRYPGTDFQSHVWRKLLEIGYGRTRSYEQIAESIGNPNAQRAVGKANGDNRIAIVIPCHRVIRADGKLSGYGGGLRRKQWLLEHERSVSRAVG